MKAAQADASLLQKVREEQDWRAIYQTFLDPSQPIRVLQSNEVPELQSSPVHRHRSSSPVKRQISPPRLRSKQQPPMPLGPLGLMPGNDWRKRLGALEKTAKPAPKSVSTAHGSVVIVPMKRGRGRPPKNAVPAQKIIVVPALVQPKEKVTEMLGDFAIERPLHYIRHAGIAAEADARFDPAETPQEEAWVVSKPEVVEYDMDEQDVAWLRLWNAERKAAGLERVDEDAVELVIDHLEKYWFHLTKAYQKWQSRVEESALAGQDFLCEICGDGETTASNVIVICDGCDVAVHQECYGVVHIPEGPWLCRRCYIGGANSGATKCSLCPWTGGALKQTTDPRRPWAHLLCARYLPAHEAPVLNAAFQEPVDIWAVDPGRWALTCQYCKAPKTGAPTQCAVKSCHVAFHPMCAKHVGATLDYSGSLAYCWKHSAPKTKVENPHEDEGDEEVDVERHDDDDDDDTGVAVTSSPMTRRGRGRPPKSQHGQQQPKKQEQVQPVPLINVAQAQAAAIAHRPRAAGHHGKPAWLLEPVVPRVILDRLLEDVSAAAPMDIESLSIICRYWSLKRAHRRGMPLLRRLQLEPWTSTSLPGEIDAARYTRLAILHDLRRLRAIAALLLERERRKLAVAAAEHDIFQLCTQPLLSVMRILLHTAIAKDPAGFFAHPVSLDDVPDYLDIIAQPMDFATLAANAESGQYPSLESFLGDLQLIWVNAMAYNQPDTIYYAAALVLRDGMKPFIAAAKKAVRDLKLDNAKGSQTILLSLLKESMVQTKAKETPKTSKPVSKAVSKTATKTSSPKKTTSSPKSSVQYGKLVWAPSAGGRGSSYFPAVTVDPSKGSRPPAKLLPVPPASLLVRFFNPLRSWAVVPADSVIALTKSLKEDLKAVEGRLRQRQRPPKAVKLDSAQFAAAHKLALQHKSS